LKVETRLHELTQVVSTKHSVPRSEDEIELTVLMPCLNEAETIGTCVTKATKFLSDEGIQGEVVVADNGSSDGSQVIAKSCGARVVPVLQKGYGAALIGGINAARGRYVVMGDSDNSYDFSNLMPFLQKLRDGADLVMGNRFRGGIEPGAMPFLHRHLGNPVLSFIGRLFFNIPIGDFHCGIRGFKTSSLRKLGLHTTGMEFASEMIVRSALAGLNLQEVPTTLAVDGRNRSPHLKTWRDGWRHLKFLLMYSPRWLFLFPGAAMVALGFGLAVLLIAGPLPISQNIILDINSFVAACFFIIVGTQLLTIGAIARLFAMRAGFLPRSERAQYLFGWLSTNRLAQIAGCLFILGLVGLCFALWQWMKVDFGPLTSPVIPRVLLSALSALVVSLQTAGFAFLAGVLEIPFNDAAASFLLSTKSPDGESS
jgi:glycosyltransferase involved in cell wall biosynthesis